MTASEFEREFDILYNNIMSNAAPSIDSYEKSVFLTKAQDEIVTALYEGNFEGSERLTECLNTLVVSTSFNSVRDAIQIYSKKYNLISHKSKAFELKHDILYIVYESIITSLNGVKEIPVRPVRHDEYSRIRNNPFKRPRNSEAIRITSSQELVNQGNKTILEIISSYDEFIYKIRYIRKPKPIILYTEPGLTIEGEDGTNLETDLDKRNPCELDSKLHKVILDAAVKLAALTYKQ